MVSDELIAECCVIMLFIAGCADHATADSESDDIAHADIENQSLADDDVY